MQRSYVYILTNKLNTVLYTGVTSDLKRRILEHQNSKFGGFSAKYKTHKLIYYEEFADIRYAIAREKQIKSWSRKRKEELINTMNPIWADFMENE